MSQCNRILNWLKSGKPLTHDDAKHLFGCNRLAARIKDLRLQGHNIITQIIKVPTRFGAAKIARYSYSAREIS